MKNIFDLVRKRKNNKELIVRDYLGTIGLELIGNENNFKCEINSSIPKKELKCWINNLIDIERTKSIRNVDIDISKMLNHVIYIHIFVFSNKKSYFTYKVEPSDMRHENLFFILNEALKKIILKI